MDYVVLPVLCFVGAAVGYFFMHRATIRRDAGSIGVPPSSQVVKFGDSAHVYPDATTRIKTLTDARYNLRDADEDGVALRKKIDDAIEELIPWVGKDGG